MVFFVREGLNFRFWLFFFLTFMLVCDIHHVYDVYWQHSSNCEFVRKIF